MSNDNQSSIRVGARLFPGVDLTLWFYLVAGVVIGVALITGAILLAVG